MPPLSAKKPAPAIDRRAALQLFASGVALALGSCGRPNEQVVPYVSMPERETPGVPLRFATALPLAGYGRGVIVAAMEGRPIKIDGNPLHPASLGATDIFAEAAILSLYDPDRSKAPFAADRIRSWDEFSAALQGQLSKENQRHGAALRLLTGRVTSPTLIAQIGELKKAMPEAQWHRYEPVDDDAVRAGAVQAFGRSLTGIPRFRDARAMVLLDADPLGCGPEQIRFAHDVVAARKVRDAQTSLRVYLAEPAWTLSGALADHRVAVPIELVRNVALTIARALGAQLPEAALPADVAQFAKAAAGDLLARRGAALVIAGPRQPAEVHALCHWINNELRAPIDFIEPVDAVNTSHADSLRSLIDDMHAGRVETLITLGANPIYEAPAKFGFAEACGRVPFSVHCGLYRDETALQATWHVPLSHPLESWSDIRAFDGTASIIQPLIRPLHDSRTAHEVMALLGGAIAPSSFDIVRGHWRPTKSNEAEFDGWWSRTLEDGVGGGTTSPKISPTPPKLPQVPSAAAAAGFTIVFAPDPAVFDGSVSNNAWLQECPKPFSKQVWGNALHISDTDARDLGVVDGDVVRLTKDGRAIEAPIFVQAGQAPRTIAATLGYGRTAAGTLGSAVGFDVAALRAADRPWVTDNVVLTRTEKTQNLLRTQQMFALEGEAEELQPRLTLAALDAGKFSFNKPDANPPTLYAPHQYDTYRWAMSIDTSACIGCNACVIACQAENNVPIVGPAEIAQGRDMHWLRVDEYTVDGKPGFSPVLCMHCEHAPCEPVCPVAASVHDSEGLNLQVYNRCVGTRFCQSNCPYKVRRFNFFGYADGEEYGNFGADIVKAVFNPDVTVRARGVMEKCTYCVQRISRSRRAAEKEGRPIHEGEVVTACQAACPTQAISFGDLSNPQSAVNRERAEPHAYALLGELGTRPRTTYLARLSNPNPEFGGV